MAAHFYFGTYKLQKNFKTMFPSFTFRLLLRQFRWENHGLYVQAIQDLRIKELRCESRMAAVRCGLSSVVPLHVLFVMTPYDMEIRTCGLPSLDLGFLKVCSTELM